MYSIKMEEFNTSQEQRTGVGDDQQEEITEDLGRKIERLSGYGVCILHISVADSRYISGVVGYVDEPTECEFAVWKWAEKALNELEEEDSEDSKKLRDFLFFLHVPRTGGRTLSQCIALFTGMARAQIYGGHIAPAVGGSRVPKN
eukprot:Gb_27872 [translate_table: standard]